jgi:geranylgeranyl diphosphate synthase, type II
VRQSERGAWGVMSDPTEGLTAAVLDLLPPDDAGLREELRAFHALMRDYPERGGKRLRGRLVLLSTEAHGGHAEAAVPVAAALELFQNWVLVHDDIEDDSEERRGQPALHRMVGVPVALNVGDAMHVAMWRALLALQRRDGFDADAIRSEFLTTIERTAEGQHLDLTWVAEGRFALDEEDYLEMVRLKTAAYTVTGPLRMGAHASGVPPHEAFASIGDRLGAAFQIRDDVLNLMPPHEGTPYGKEFAGDLLEGKRTLILAHLLAHATSDEGDEVVRRLAAPRGERSDTDVAWILERIERHGSLRYAQRRAEELASGALADLSEALAPLPGRAAVERILSVMGTLVQRTH